MTAHRKTHHLFLPLLTAGILLSLTVLSFAQATSTTTKTPRTTTGALTIDTAQVVYTSGDDAVLKMPDGSLQLFELQPGTSLTIDGRPATAADLSPGMTLSHLQLHSRTQSDVTTVKQIDGIVMGKSGRILNLRLDDGTSKFFSVPHDATFEVDGRRTTFDNVTRGMRVSVTAVTTGGHTLSASRGAMVARTPPQSGTLVVESPGPTGR
ncbi:MAG: hypothetical protein FWD64_02640 [Acidobacteriaceae bacterium]|nr:hypothetical protein [Acidobacteriaceae bacterium]